MNPNQVVFSTIVGGQMFRDNSIATPNVFLAIAAANRTSTVNCVNVTTGAAAYYASTALVEPASTNTYNF
jgi:hypothetical protein